jgi:hypothetical protein
MINNDFESNLRKKTQAEQEYKELKKHYDELYTKL